MNVLVLGGAGKICSEAVLDLVAYSDFKRIAIADCEQKAGEALAAAIDDGRVDFCAVDRSPGHLAAAEHAAGAVRRSGVIMPEFAFEPQLVIVELARRKILVHETICEL